MRGHELDVSCVEHLGDHRQPGCRARHREELECFSAESLKAVWRGAWLERASAQHHCAGTFDRPRRLQQHLAPFHRAGARDHGELDVTDSDTIGDADDGARGGGSSCAKIGQHGPEEIG
jgi:hypothetical protein